MPGAPSAVRSGIGPARMVDSQPRDHAWTVIRLEAEAAARNYGLDAERVVRIFERIVQHYFGEPLPNDPEIVDAIWFMLRRPTPLDHALHYIPPHAALA